MHVAVLWCDSGIHNRKRQIVVDVRVDTLIPAAQIESAQSPSCFAAERTAGDEPVAVPPESAVFSKSSGAQTARPAAQAKLDRSTDADISEHALE